MPIPIDGISSTASASPMVTNPTCGSSAMRVSFLFSEESRELDASGKPPGLARNERLLDDQRLQELDALLASVLLRHDRILVLEREHEVVADLEQRGDDAPPPDVAPAGHAV